MHINPLYVRARAALGPIIYIINPIVLSVTKHSSLARIAVTAVWLSRVRHTWQREPKIREEKASGKTECVMSTKDAKRFMVHL